MIHKYFLNGYYIVLDVNSGAVHVVDELSYTLLDYLDENMTEHCPEKAIKALKEKYTEQEIASCYQALYELYQAGQLFSSDDYAQFSNLMVSAPIKAMCLHIAHDCNLRCKYCFASTGDFGEGRKYMSFEEVGRRLLIF